MIIYTIPTSDCTPQTIVIGRRGTYDTLQIAFDLSYLIESYGNGVAVLAVKRSQDTSAYPAVVAQEDNTLTWTVSETDTYYVGSGECQLMWYVDGGLAKTIIYPMVVMRDILSTAEEPPDGYENWIESLTALGAATQQNAQNAAQSATDAETAQGLAEDAKDAAVDAQNSAEANALKSEGFAIGEQNGTPVSSGSPYYEDNAKYMKEAAAGYALQSDSYAGESAAWATGSYSGNPLSPTQGIAQTDNNAYYYAQQAAADAALLENCSASASTLSPGSSATASYANGVFSFGIPSGATGATPEIFATATTLAAGSSATANISGTIEQPLITFGIPRGDTGATGATGATGPQGPAGVIQSVNGKSAASITLAAGDIGYADSATYTDGTVGKAVSDLNRQINDVESALNTDKNDIINLANYVGTKYTFNGNIEHSTSVQNTKEILVKIQSGDSVVMSITDTTNNNVTFSYYVRYENAGSLTYLGEVTTGGASKTFIASNNIVSFAFYKSGLTAGTLSLHVEASNPSATAKDLEEKCDFVPKLMETTNSILENAKGNLLLNEYPGFIAANGSIDPQNATNLEKYTGYIECKGKISINLTYAESKVMYIVYAKYDQSKTFIKRTYIVSGDSRLSYSGILDLDELDAEYVRISYRSYGSTIIIGKELDFGDIATTHISTTVKTVAHRGDDIIGPQCTAPSYIIAKKRGINVFENDVNITDDGDLVMWHDSNLSLLWNMVDINGYLMYTDETDYYWVHPDTNNVYTYENGEYIASEVSIDSLTRCRGDIYSVNSLGSYTGLSMEVLKRIDFGIWKNTRFAGTQILTFEEWVLLCKQLGADIYIDRKATYTNEIISSMANILIKLGMSEHASWLGLSVDQINYLRQIIPGARCGTNNHPTSALIELFTPVNTGKGFFFNCDGHSMTESAIQLGLNSGFEVEVWYVDFGSETEEQVYTALRNAVSYGATGITTDHYRVDEAFNYLFDLYHIGN